MKFKKLIFSSLQSIKIHSYWIFFQLFKYKPNVLTPEETIEYIKKHNASIARFGDGEFRLMINRGEIGFQEYSSKLEEMLNDCFRARDPKLLVCSFDFKTKWKADNHAGRWLRRFVQSKYNQIEPLFDRKYLYGNTDVSRFYNPALFRYTDFDYLKKTYIPLLKTLWDKKRVLIVEGAKTKLGLGNDLFDNTLSIRRILCPVINAFNSYDQIYQAVVKSHIQGELVVLALGPTATILSTYLTLREKIQCLDVGHVDVCYIWFLNKSQQWDKIDGKYVNEAVNNITTIETPFDLKEEEKYQKQIIMVIQN